MLSSGTIPVIALYKVAPTAYTSDQGPCSPLLLYCSSGAYPGFNITDRLLLWAVVAYLDAPKSISLTSSLGVIKILSGLMSL